MNRRMIIRTIGNIIKLEAVLLVLPALVALCYSEFRIVLCFSVTSVAAFIFGFLITVLARPSNKIIYAREGFIIVAFAWIALSAIGSIPFVLSQEIPNFFDAFFETVSGFTTTGATILTDVESMSKGLLFWRSFTHWLGGMGILVLMVAILPSENGRAIHILRAEMAGPIIGKLVPKLKDTAKILYIIYFGLTAMEFFMLLFGGMSVFESSVIALGTAGTGGFGTKGDSIASYSPYIQWVVTAFMFLFGVNFNLYYLIYLKRFKSIFKNSELLFYLGIVLAASAYITLCIYPIYNNASDSIRNSFFQVVSVISTTGFSTADFNLWPGSAKSILFILLFFGGCAGSTAGGLKLSRVMLLLKSIAKDVHRMIHPRSVSSVKIDGKAIDNDTLHGVTVYFTLYMILIFSTFVLISLEPFSFETNLTAAISCCNNVGPGFDAVGPMGSFAGYSNFGKLVLSFAMLFGRLEIYPMLLAFYPKTWSKK